MKITQIHGYTEDGATRIDLAVDSDLSVAEAISSVLALFAGETSPTLLDTAPAEVKAEVVKMFSHLNEQMAAEANIVEEPAPKAEKATRTRRPRTNPDAAPASDAIPAHYVAANAGALEAAAAKAEQPRSSPETERRRTRVTAEPAAPEVKTITDADLAKACSNAAAIVGIEVVQAVIADFHVASMQELAPDVREKFLSELDDEIRLAKEELAKAGQ